MKDNPHAVLLDDLAQVSDPLADAVAMKKGAAAIRALAQFRPHWPSLVAGDQVAVLYVPHAAMMDARAVLGDYDLGPWDQTQAQQALDDARAAKVAELSRAERREKYELRR